MGSGKPSGDDKAPSIDRNGGPSPLTSPPSPDYLSPGLLSLLFASMALEMIAAPSGHGEETGDGPEAGRDSSPLPGRGHGGVRCHHVLHAGHHGATPLPEKVRTCLGPSRTPTFCPPVPQPSH
jgi:hypothetical protein